MPTESLKEAILTYLEKINYPGFNRSIISFGVVSDIILNDDNVVVVTLSFSTKDDKVKDQIISSVNSIIEQNFSDDNIQIKVTDLPSPQMNNDNQKNNFSGIKKIIAIASGKGGVGKSTMSINIACELSKRYNVGLLDLDIYGPSLPILIGEQGPPKVNAEQKLIPIEKFGMKFMSFGFLNTEKSPAIWRGPMVAKMTNQFFDEVDWGELDYLVLDLPPGTGDIQLTLVQKIALTGAIIITTPQDLALEDVRKGADMFKKVNTPVLGVIENMSSILLRGKVSPWDINDNNKKIAFDSLNKTTDIDNNNGEFVIELPVFSGKGGEQESKRLNVDLLGKIPLDPILSKSSDGGTPICISEPGNYLSKKISQIVNIIDEYE